MIFLVGRHVSGLLEIGECLLILNGGRLSHLTLVILKDGI